MDKRGFCDLVQPGLNNNPSEIYKDKQCSASAQDKGRTGGQAVSGFCLSPLKKLSQVWCAPHVGWRLMLVEFLVDLSCASKVFLRVLHFFSRSKINTFRTTGLPLRPCSEFTLKKLPCINKANLMYIRIQY